MPPMPLRVQGRYILDATGKRVRLKCASWSGAQVHVSTAACHACLQCMQISTTCRVLF
jgi:hypothetical protein